MKTILGYSDKISVAPGETIDFKISCETGSDYEARLVRLICGDTNPEGPGYREEPVAAPLNRKHSGRAQPIHAGSYAVISDLPNQAVADDLTFQALIWPTAPGRGEQVIASWWRDGKGFELCVDASGALLGRLGDGRGHIDTATVREPMLERRWYLAALRFDAARGLLTVLQRPLKPHALANDGGQASIAVAMPPETWPDAPLLLAARALDGAVSRYERHYNGKIESPRLYAAALAEIDLEVIAPLQRAPLGLIGAWDFSRDIETTRFPDLSGADRHGEFFQAPQRAMTGHNWTDDCHSWRAAPDKYGAVHFHDDALYDAAWETSLSWAAPVGQRSGVYALHVRTAEDEDYIPFVVRPGAGATASKVLFLLPTASYLAYGNEHMAIDFPHAERAHDVTPVFYAHDLFLMAHREYGNSLYDTHSDGAAVCMSSRMRPLLNMRPKQQSWLAGLGSGLWQFNADTHLTDWLEARGVDYDVITDEDLDRDGVAALAPYRCIVTGTHAEYLSTNMWDALEAYKARGGNLMAMGGNAFYWRIAYHAELPGVLEVRRNGGPPGEGHHAFSGEMGGLWSTIGRSPNTMAGAGFVGQGFDISSYYRRLPAGFDARAAFIFEGVDEEIIGDFGLIGGGAAGLELDRANLAKGTPPNALVLAASENHTSIYMLSTSEMLINMPGQDATQAPQLHAELVFYETPAGGAVFNTGSIAWSGSLSHNGYDNNVSRITGNVLRRFIDGEPFATAGA